MNCSCFAVNPANCKSTDLSWPKEVPNILIPCFFLGVLRAPTPHDRCRVIQAIYGGQCRGNCGVRNFPGSVVNMVALRPTTTAWMSSREAKRCSHGRTRRWMDTGASS